jgi:hypothetical protein
MSRTPLALVNKRHERASLVNLVARDKSDHEGQVLACAILSMTLELERHIETSKPIGATREAKGS